MMESSVTQAYVYGIEHKGTLRLHFLWLPVSSAIFNTAIDNAYSLDMDIQTNEYGILSAASYCSARNTRKLLDTIQQYTGWIET